MLMKALNKLLLGLALVVSALSGAGCGSDTVTESAFEPPAPLSTEKYIVAGVITDPDGAPLSSTVTFFAKDSTGADVVLYADSTRGGKAIRGPLQAANGSVAFFVPPAASLPVVVKVVANAPGRLSSSAVVNITAEGGYGFDIELWPAWVAGTGLFVSAQAWLKWQDSRRFRRMLDEQAGTKAADAAAPRNSRDAAP